MSLRVGLVGCGHISAAHLAAWRRARGAEVGGVYDLDRDLAAQRAREFGVPTVFPDLESALECDLVDVCTPPASHAEIALAAIEKGRHLLVEKPLVTRMDEWEKIQAARADSPATLTVVHNIKFTSGIRRVGRWLEAGRIGEVLRFRRLFLTSPATDRMLDGDGHWARDLPGGRWQETLPHELYLLHHLVGPLSLARVIALSTPRAPGAAPADEVTIVLEGQRTLATIEYSAHCEANRRTLELDGTLGRIEVDVLSGAALLQTTRDGRLKRALGRPFLEAARALGRAGADRGDYLLDRARGRTAHAELIRALVAHIAGAGPPPTPLDEIDYVIRNADAIGRAIDAQLAAASREPAG